MKFGDEIQRVKFERRTRESNSIANMVWKRHKMQREKLNQDLIAKLTQTQCEPKGTQHKLLPVREESASE